MAKHYIIDEKKKVIMAAIDNLTDVERVKIKNRLDFGYTLQACAMKDLTKPSKYTTDKIKKAFENEPELLKIYLDTLEEYKGEKEKHLMALTALKKELKKQDKKLTDYIK